MPQDIKRIYREREEAKLGGVCAGLGTYLGIDPVFTGFVFGIVGYLLAWLIIPQRPVPPEPARTVVEAPHGG